MVKAKSKHSLSHILNPTISVSNLILMLHVVLWCPKALTYSRKEKAG